MKKSRANCRNGRGKKKDKLKQRENLCGEERVNGNLKKGLPKLGKNSSVPFRLGGEAHGEKGSDEQIQKGTHSPRTQKR